MEAVKAFLLKPMSRRTSPATSRDGWTHQLSPIDRRRTLVEPTRQQVAELFQKAKMSPLATPNICQQIDLLSKQDLIPESDALPQL
jgi:hypothetical protein